MPLWGAGFRASLPCCERNNQTLARRATLPTKDCNPNPSLADQATMTLNVLGAARANDSLRAQPPLTGRLGKGGEAQVGGTGGGFQRQRSGQFVYANRIAERRGIVALD